MATRLVRSLWIRSQYLCRGSSAIQLNHLSPNPVKRFPRLPINVSGRTISIDSHVKKDGAQVDVVFNSGIPFDIPHEFDYTWKPYLWSLQKVFHSIRADLTIGGKYMDRSWEDVKTNPSFILGCRNEVLPEFYDVVRNNPNAPVLVRILLNDLGTTSYGTMHELRSLDTDTLLCNLYAKIVNLNSETKTPEPIPDESRRKLTPHVTGSGIPLMKAHQKKGNCFTYHTKMLPCDVDFYDQISYMSYIVHCYNCAVAAFQGTTLQNFTGEFVPYNVKKVSSLYLAPAQLHDEIFVDMWEDEKDSDTLNFIVRKTGVDLFHCAIQLYV